MNTKRIIPHPSGAGLPPPRGSLVRARYLRTAEFSSTAGASRHLPRGRPCGLQFPAATPILSTVWTGDTGRIQHKDRTTVDVADIRSCELEIEISQRYGAEQPIDLFRDNKFAGLNGSDAATDHPWSKPCAAQQLRRLETASFHAEQRQQVQRPTPSDITESLPLISHGACTSIIPDPKTTCDTYQYQPKITVPVQRVTTRRYTTTWTWVRTLLARRTQHMTTPTSLSFGQRQPEIQGQPGAGSIQR